jgi:hypothetical protein
MTSTPACDVRDDSEEFFIGYAPPMPPQVARFVRAIVIGLVCVLLAWAVTVGAAHVTLEGGTFEFGHPQSFAGIIVEHPYPALRPNEGDRNGMAWPLLVAPGKRGADALVRGLDGRHVTLTGTHIRRDSQVMIEIDPSTLVALGAPGTTTPTSPGDTDIASGPIRIRGEVVDSKCFLGVMVPGSGKTHKDCASLCLRGGIPPAVNVKDRSGKSAVMLLTHDSGEPIGVEAIAVAGEAIDMTGTVERQGGWLVFRTNPASWLPVAR